MFHRDDTAVPVLPVHLRWPLPEFFSTDPPDNDGGRIAAEVEALAATNAAEAASVQGCTTSKQAEATADRLELDAKVTGAEAEAEAEAEEIDFTALPAQGAVRKTGGVGVPLDMATRLSAAGALTWWHLDDCGEFVFQVGLPLDLDRPRHRHRAHLQPGKVNPDRGEGKGEAEGEGEGEGGACGTGGSDGKGKGDHNDTVHKMPIATGTTGATGGDGDGPRNPGATPRQPVLLGPTGRPVVKLFVFADKEDYEWVAQDGWGCGCRV